jgi:hypothetical protein
MRARSVVEGCLGNASYSSLIMIIIFGSKVRYKTLSTGQFYCPQCKARRDYELRQARNWFSVYFIPVIPLNQIGELVTCCT